MLNQTTIINCNSKCELEEVWMCMGRDRRTGLPNKLMPCPLGARNTSDSCKKARCEYVFIPLRNRSQLNHNTGDDYIQKIWTKFVYLILLLILLKLVLFFCGGFCTFLFSYLRINDVFNTDMYRKKKKEEKKCTQSCHSLSYSNIEHITLFR